MQLERPVDDVVIPTVVPGHIPQFPNLEEYMIEEANYPDLHEPPPQVPPMKRYLPRPESTVFKVSTTDTPPPPPLQQLNEDIQHAIDNLTLAPPVEKPKPSLLSQLLVDFNLWRKTRPRKKYIEIRTESDLVKLLHGIRNENADQLPFSPTFILEKKTQLSQLISMFAPTDVLIRAGFQNLTAEQLADHGLTISNLRCYQRSPTDMAKLYTTFEHLLATGFNHLHFDSRLWSLESFAAAFKIDPPLMAHMCQLNARDLMYAGVAPENLPRYGITGEHIRDDPHPFELYYAINMNPFQLRTTFKFNISNLFKNDAPIMNTTQICILWHRCKWNKENLFRIGATKQDLRQLGIPIDK